MRPPSRLNSRYFLSKKDPLFEDPQSCAMQNVPRISLISLGCSKNLVDTERLTSALVAMGYVIAPPATPCDLVIVNTCGFINAAIEESLDNIGEALSHQKKVIVMGCLGAKADLICERFPEVLKVIGPGRRAAVLREVIAAVGRPPQDAAQKISEAGIILTPPHYAYLKIAEGCRHACSFCIIPSLRGKLRSRTSHDILKEARALVREGAKELLIIAQDTSDYGRDLKDGSTLSSLLNELSKLKVWLRVHYVYPGPEALKAVELMAEHKVLPYLDVPFQHVSPSILRAMRRPGTIDKTLSLIEEYRKICPDIAIRSTFITGFPGETKKDFQELVDFLKEARLDRVGCFPYSDVQGAAANDFDDAVPFEVREERAQILMQTQAQISYQKLQERVGKSYEVLVDFVSEEGQAVGRSIYESPDVDGCIIIEDGALLRPGSKVKVKITSHDEHDLSGAIDRTFNSSLNFRHL